MTPAIQRITSIDALRGLVMIIMALDHTREFFHIDAMSFQPEDLTRTNAVLFFTRWVTFFCAPVFMFTAGAAAFFKLNRTQDKKQLSHFLWTRGLWLILLELTILRFAIFFSLTSSMVLLTILYALGGSMILLALLIHLPIRILSIVSIGIILLHNLFTPISAAQFGPFNWVWNLLYQPGVFLAGPVPFFVAYPVIPWAAVMAAGFCFGRVYLLPSKERCRILSFVGWSCIAAFFVLRGINLYGDPVPWSTQIPGAAILSFFNCTKYPPSLDFILMTMGPAFLLLSWIDRIQFQKNNPLLIFGRTPLFYFLIHFFLIHALTIPFALVRYGSISFLRHPLPSLGGPSSTYPPDFGYSLWLVYAVWIAVVVALYPMCRWYSRIKESNRYRYLRYL